MYKTSNLKEISVKNCIKNINNHFLFAKQQNYLKKDMHFVTPFNRKHVITEKNKHQI